MAKASPPSKTRPPARNRTNPLKVVVRDEDERGEIQARAARLNMSVSEYLRTLGLNYPIKTTADAAAIDRLLQINADMGRLGGLLKMWLSSRRGEGATSAQVQQMLRDLQATQQEMREAISELRKRR